MKILSNKSFVSAATDWGILNEQNATDAYVSFMKSSGHDVVVSSSGFYISLSHCFLGASPDGVVFDPTSIDQPYGFLEIKCPYSVRDKTPEDACSSSGFACTLEKNNGKSLLRLRRNHIYFAQIQGQMAVGIRPWCDFVVFTTKGISVQRIPFDNDYWDNELLPKLIDFYENCLAPEIVSPIHVLGMPVRDLRCT